MEEKLPAGLGKGQIAELVEDDGVLAGEIVGDAALATGARLGLEPIDEIDGGEKAAARSRPNAASFSGSSNATRNLVAVPPPSWASHEPVVEFCSGSRFIE